MTERKNIFFTMEELEQCLDDMAVIVQDFGPAYLPLFKELSDERERRLTNKDILDVALERAQHVQQQENRI